MVYDLFEDAYNSRTKLLIVLIDPQVVEEKKKLLDEYIESFKMYKPSMVFVGGSLIFDSVEPIVKKIKQYCDLPVVLFPGHATQFTPLADAILFLSLISGRNSEYLIGQHVVAAPLIKKAKTEVISTGYILIESGKLTSVEYMSNTKPIPNNKVDILKATALAGEMLGHKLIYLESGSGAEKSISYDAVFQVVKYIGIPVIVGGGITSPEQVIKLYEAGATGVVLGSLLEKNPFLLRDFIKKKNESFF